VEPDDLIDSHEVAELLGLGSHRSVSVYRARYDDFPDPVIEKGSGKCLLWLRADIETWAAGRV
jgi:predicted DNA-binding transcriptional regulator AlpA